MRPQPVIVFGDLQQWLQTHKVEVGRMKLEIDACENNIQQQPSKKQCAQQQETKCHSEFASPVMTPLSAFASSLPQHPMLTENPTSPSSALSKVVANSPAPLVKPTSKVQTTLLPVVKQTVVTKKPFKTASTKPAIKAPLGIPQVRLCSSSKPSKQDGRFRDFAQWCTLRKTAELCCDPLPDNKTKRSVDIAVFSERRIDQLTQMYSMKILPHGHAVGDYAMCIKLQGRELRHIPAFLPTKQQMFGIHEHEMQSVINQFRKLWFRVSFVGKDKHSDEIVHFKDLCKENSFLALKPLLHALFVHLAQGNSALQDVFEFALDAVANAFF